MSEDDLGTKVDRLSEEVETVENLHEEVLLLLLDDGELGLGNRLSVGVELGRDLTVSEGSDEEPDRSGNGEEDRGEEEGVVVSESLDSTRRGERSGGTGDLVENVDGGIHSSELSSVSTNDVGGDNLRKKVSIRSIGARERLTRRISSTIPYATPAKVQTTKICKGNGTNQKSCEKKGKIATNEIRVPASVVGSGGGVGLDGSSGGGIDNEEDRGHESEEEDGGGENGSSGEFFDERTIEQDRQLECEGKRRIAARGGDWSRKR